MWNSVKKKTKPEKIALIATLPKSGTWYSHTFFWCYEQLLSHQHDYREGRFKPDLETALKNREIAPVTSHINTLGIARLHICHTICPGYDRLQDRDQSRWEGLHFPVPGYNWGEEALHRDHDWDRLDCHINPDSRIVYLYRNPLDQFISYYHHAIHHVDDNHRHKTGGNGERIPITNLHDFIFKFSALSGFIKHYHTYKQMKKSFPDNILMIAYEDLTSSPDEVFYKMLSFLDAAPDVPEKLHFLEEALSLCSKEALMKIESKFNNTMVNDQTPGERHIRGGETGKWKNFLDASQVEAIEIALNAFGISLKDFTLIK